MSIDISHESPFGNFLKIRMTELTEEGAKAELTAVPELGNMNGAMHGGAILSLVDLVGGMAARMHLAPDETTVTMDNKVNFLLPIPVGQTAWAHASPVHIGRTTSVWQIRVTRDDGKLAAIGTQTQFTVKKR